MSDCGDLKEMASDRQLMQSDLNERSITVEPKGIERQDSEN